MLLLRTTVDWTPDEVSETAEDTEDTMLLAMIDEDSTIEVSEIVEARDDSTLLLGTIDVDTSGEVSTTLDVAMEDIWDSVLVLGRTDDCTLELTVDEINADVWDSIMLLEAIEEITDDDSIILPETRAVVEATAELLTMVSLITLLDEIPDDTLSEIDADVELTILLSINEVETTLDDRRTVTDGTEDDETTELSSEDVTLAKLVDGSMDEIMLLDTTDDDRTTDDVSVGTATLLDTKDVESVSDSEADDRLETIVDDSIIDEAKVLLSRETMEDTETDGRTDD